MLGSQGALSPIRRRATGLIVVLAASQLTP